MSLGSNPGVAVVLVTGGSSQPTRDVARGLAVRAWPVVVVYLEDQSGAEATVAQIIAAGGTTVAVRADLTDDFDVQRMFTESITAFGGVDAIVHMTTDNADLLYQHAARYVRRRGVIVSTYLAELVPPWIATQLRERGITAGRVSPDEVLAFLDRWSQQTTG
jgi:3-oxoacyl-[acyl-carrier protein] reductase